MAARPSQLRTATWLALGAMVGWGLAYVPSAWLLDTWPPLMAAGVRLGLAGILILGVLLASGTGVSPRTGVHAILWLALTQTVLFYGATFIGIQEEGAGIAAVLVNTDPLWVAVLGALFLHERLVAAQWVGIAIGFIGMGVVVWRGPLWPPDVGPAALFLLGGALAWAIGTITATRSVRGRGEPIAIAGWQMAAGGIALVVWGLLAGESAGPLDGREIGLIFGLAILGSGLPLALFYLALDRAPAAVVSAWFFLIPLIGVLSAWPILGETPTARLWLGLAGVCVGLVLVMIPDALTEGRRRLTGPR